MFPPTPALVASAFAFIFTLVQLAGTAQAARVPVTVTVTSVTSVSGGDIFSRPDFYARINIDGAWFEAAPIFDFANLAAPGWSLTRLVSLTERNGFTPIRIELREEDAPFDDEHVDIDPAVCEAGPFGSGCAVITIGREPVDMRGIDLDLNLINGTWAGLETTGDATSPTACATGTEGQTATLCFTITVGARVPETLVVSKTTDSDRSGCRPGDCSLREAIATAEDGDTVVVPASTAPYRLTVTDGLATFAINPGHLKIARRGLIIQGPTSGGNAVIQQTVPEVRVFDVHNDASVTMNNLTITGGGAGNNSTAFPGHIHGGGIHNHGTVELNNVTITGNRANSTEDRFVGGGGGMYNAGTAKATLNNVTIADNEALIGGGGLGGPGPFFLHNTLIVNNRGKNPENGLSASCTAEILRYGGSLQYPKNDCYAAMRVARKNPIFPLAPDFTYELSAASDAIDGGESSSCPAGDQLGVVRPIDGDGDGDPRCDVGSIEFDPAALGVIQQPIDSSTGRPGPVTLRLDGLTQAGTTTLATASAGPPPPAGFRPGNPARYHDLATTAGFTGNVRLCFDYTGTTFGNETGLRVFQWLSGTWHDVTDLRSLDPGGDGICARAPSLSVFAIFQQNQSPVAWIDQPPDLMEGGSAVLLGRGSDADGDPLTFRWSPATGLDDLTKAAPTFVPRDEGTYTFTLVVSDAEASSAPVSVTVNVGNAAPLVSITAPARDAGHRVGAAVDLTGPFTDAGKADVHTCAVSWGDGTPAAAGTVDEAGGAGTCRSRHHFAAAGVYTVRVTVDDGDGGVATSESRVAIFDPKAGALKGAGWFQSAAGAHRASPGVAGSAAFGIAAGYLAGGTTPVGLTALHLGASRLVFTSTSHDWLVVVGRKAQLSGRGAINGSGSHRFLLTATDGGDGPADRLRLKIWDRAGGAIVYDNVLDAAAGDDIDNARPQSIARGALVIQRGR